MNDPFRPYRRQYRTWANDRRLRLEGEFYAGRFAARGLAIPDEDALRDTLRRQFPHLRPKPPGGLRILALYHHYTWENDALKPSLEKFGLVRHYDWCGPFDHQARGWHPSGRSRMNRHLQEELPRWVRQDGTDVIFAYLSGEIVTVETMEALHTLGIPMINLALNDKEHFTGRIRRGQAMGNRDICRYFHLSWTSTEDALVKYCVEGALPIYLPEGANPDLHRPWPLEQDIDVSFVGQCYGNRPAVIEALRQRGIRVEAFGPGWPAGPLTADGMVRLYARSRINLGFGGVIGHTDTYCLKGRDFEIPMSGGLYLTEHHPELERVYEIGQEIVTYRGLEDLEAKIRDLLAHPEKAQAIRQRGYERALRDHSWEMRFAKIFRLIGLIGDP